MRLVPLLPLLAVLITSPAHAQLDRARDLVNPFIGTGGHGHTFPGACVPNGLVQLSPDTRTSPSEWDGCGGYHYSDSVIFGFSHTHLNGTGCADLCDVLLMPTTGRSLSANDYASRFSHTDEHASAGHYAVHLLDDDIQAELTAAAHTGVHRYTFSKGAQARLVIDLAHRDKLLAGYVEPISPTEVVGERRSSSWARDQHLFFCMRFSRPMTMGEHGYFLNSMSDDVAPLKRAQRVVLDFGRSSEPLVIKVGISAVSIEGARANMDAEVPGWDFDAVRKQAADAWNAKLSKVEVEGGTRAQQRIFYTALYHCYIVPSVFSDVDGNYRGMDGQVHHADHPVYTVFSLWDTFRALHPLMTILEPGMTNDFIRTFLLHYQQGGKLPVWELWGNETDCMIGYHSVSVIADAYMKGIRGFDAELALKAMVASASSDDPGAVAFRTRGFISSEDGSDDVSRTLEYAYDDGCISHMAEAMRNQPSWDKATADRLDSVALTYKRRASNWANLLNPHNGFVQARRNGGFIRNFDPFEVNFHYTEANAWQYRLFAPQDIDHAIELHGGKAGYAQHLDDLFSAATTTTGREQPDIAGLIGQYAHGNEPSHNMVYLYDRVGHPEKARALAKRIMDEFYHDAPDGLIGNEDCGQMSAWFVMSALGLYQIAPGIDDRYDFGYPLFDKAVIHMPDGRSWTMGVLPAAKDGKQQPTGKVAQGEGIPDCVHHAQLVRGGAFWYNADRTPRLLEADLLPGNSPATPTTDTRSASAPVIDASGATFTSTMEIKVEGKGTCTFTDDQGRHTCPMNTPFTVDRTATVTVDWSDHYAPVTAHFTRIDGQRTVKLESTYANQYAGGGDQALVDGLQGGPDLRSAEWQGFQGQDVVATVDLGTVRTLKRAGLRVLQDQHAWVWYPSEVTFAWSMNGRQWSTATVQNTVDRKADGAMTTELWAPPIGTKARYLKVVAKNAGPCPDWHPGKGGATWIFADEILTEVE